MEIYIRFLFMFCVNYYLFGSLIRIDLIICKCSVFCVDMSDISEISIESRRGIFNVYIDDFKYLFPFSCHKKRINER